MNEEKEEKKSQPIDTTIDTANNKPKLFDECKNALREYGFTDEMFKNTSHTFIFNIGVSLIQVNLLKEINEKLTK